VDNGSTDDTAKVISVEFPMVNCLELHKNYGFSGAVNAGIEHAKTNDVILLNNDTQVEAGWLDALKNHVQRYEDFSLFTSHVFQADGSQRVDTTGDGFTVAGFGYKHDWLQQRDSISSEPREVFGGSGCALYIRRDVFEAIGLFDEDFFAFGEDLDFSFRARLAGFRVLSVPEACVLHDVRATAASDNTLYWYHRNLIWLIIKNYPWQLLLLYLPHVLLHMLLVLFRSILNGWTGTYLRSIFDGLAGFSKMWQKRRMIQKHRRVGLSCLRKQLDLNWPGVHYRLHKAKKSLSTS